MSTVSTAEATPQPRAPAREKGLTEAMDLSGLVAIFQRRLRVVMATVALVTVAVIALTLAITPVYTSTASIKLDLSQRSPLDLAAATSGLPPDQSLIDTEIAIMRSPDVALRVVRQMRLTEDPELGPKLARPLFGPPPPPLSPARAELITSNNVLHNLKVERDGASYIINLMFRSKDPRKAAAVANAFAREYLTNSLQLQLATASQQATWLNQRLNSLGAEVQAADAAVAQYRARTGIALSGGNQTITDQQVAPISSSLAQAESEAAAARSQLQAAREQIQKGGVGTVSNVLNSPVIADLRRQRAEVLRNQADISTRYGPKHPETLKVQQQLEDLDRSIAEEGQRIVSGLDATARAAQARASSLRGDLSSVKGAQAGDARAAVEADSLQRIADAKRAVYNQVAQAAQQEQQQQHLEETHARITTQASVPLGPSFPNVRIFAALGLVLGVIVATALVFLLEALDSSIRSVADVEEGLGARFITSVPLLKAKQLRDGGQRLSPPEFLMRKPLSGYAEALRHARSAILLPKGEQPPGVLTVTSALPGEGKTSTAVALARVFAMSEPRVLLIDGDLRRNALGRLVGGRASAGLIDVLAGKCTLRQAVVRDEISDVDILTMKKPAFTPKDLFGTDAMANFLTEARKHYAHIVIDAPPVLAVTDARTLSKLSDAVLMVVRWRSTPRQAVQTAMARLRQDGSRIYGVLLSMVDTSQSGAVSAHDPAYYYNAYAQYYQE